MICGWDSRCKFGEIQKSNTKSISRLQQRFVNTVDDPCSVKIHQVFIPE